MDRPVGNRLATVLDEKAAAAPSAPAIFYRGDRIDYAELQGRSIEAARAFLAAGVVRGDRVGVLLGNQPEFVILALAASYVGATLVPMNTWYKAGELGWTMRHAGVKLLIAVPAFLKADYRAMLGGLTDLPKLRTVLFLDSPEWAAFLAAGRRLDGATFAAATAAVRGDDDAFILYTSGSTADPKGVRLNGAGVVRNGFELGLRRGIVAEDRVWIGTPLFYGLGAANALPAAITRGAAIVLQDHFEAGAAIDVIHRTAATVYYGTGNMTRAMLDHPDYAQVKIGSLQKGNAGTVAEYKRMTLVEMGIKGAVPAYGLTESYGNATVGWPDDPLEAKIATSGFVLPTMEMRIVDPVSGADLPTGEVGLVLLRGCVTPGYLDNPIETAKAFKADGWFDTGDLGRLDGDGRFTFHARLKEVIKSGGINVSPVEVEQLIAGHPEVRDAYVVGVGDPVRGELVVAFVDAAAPLKEAEVRAYVKERAAAFKVPHHVFFRDEAGLPRLASGKVAKHRLAEEARAELGL
ncbi:class I adenylate-forming enzyme family protein [Sphingomonas profundi]|uniref:class I adenylate-forming enzyme family protein n=1 Tax=Alterirhizorhabdus profundi TaxID=2681549 RepID=UPI0012E98263|nr:AMP-binding protein [Sphingomonas profundi]